MKAISSAIHTVKAFSLIEENDSVLLAVSGGPDSVALLHLFLFLRQNIFPGIEIAIAHYDHKQRRDSAEDAKFVEILAKELSVPFFKDELKDNLFATNQRQGKESLLRDRRYEFLLRTAREYGFNKIALGHNMDDQAETFLFRLIRGSGLQGLGAMGLKSKRGGVFLIRPLLFSKKSEILDFLRQHNIAFRQDSSNSDTAFARNKIRLELLPLMEKGYNSRIKEHLVFLSEMAGIDYDFLEASAREIFFDMGLRLSPYRIVFKHGRFAGLHPSMQRMVFRLAYEYLAGEKKGLEFRHWKEFEGFLGGKPDGAILDLPKGVSVIKKKNTMEFFIRSCI